MQINSFLEKIFDFSNEQNEIYYISDRTGNIRWLFPKGSKYPSFLALYNSSTFKGKIYKLLCELAFRIKMEKLVTSGVLKASLKENIINIVNRLKGDSYSVFTGTPGEDRKVVVAVTQGEEISHFIKIPILVSSQNLVQNEYEMLHWLAQYDFKKIEIPHIDYYKNNIIAIKNVKPKYRKKSLRFTDIHIEALKELYEFSSDQQQLNKLDYMKEITSNLKELSSLQRVSQLKFLGAVKNGMISFQECVRPNLELEFALAHGDFTPWNMYADEKKIYVYDWELSKRKAPLLFDFFHYIFQMEALINHSDYQRIKSILIDYLARNKEMQIMIDQFDIDIENSYALYVLYISSSYGLKYMCQKDLHMQAEWLMDVWTDALTDIIKTRCNVFGMRKE